MKVLMINSVCGIRSTGRICTDIAQALEAEGHEVKIAYGRETVPEKFQKYAVRIGTDLDIKLHGLQTRFFDRMGFGSKKATEKFIEFVKAYDPDVIHLHNLHGYYINIEVLFDYLKTCGKKLVWTLHDCWAFTGHCSHFDYVGCDKWKSECRDCPQIKEYPKSLFIDRSLKNFHMKRFLFTRLSDMTIITPSEWLAGVVRQSFLGEYPVKAIYNGIDTSVFKPTESDFKVSNGLEGKKIILGVSSVWNDKKGFFDFIELSHMIAEDHVIVLVGVNEAQKKLLPENMLGIERTNNVKELCEIYTASDVFVNPSVEETMGLTTAEALACGTPAVVYNRTAVPEVPDEHSGIVLAENTPKAIFEAITRLDIDPVDCIARANKFLKEEKYQEYADVYMGKHILTHI